MQNIIIQNINDEVVFRFKKNVFNANFLVSLLKRLEIEELAQKADVNEEILELANEIDYNWWKENGQNFLEGIE